jgi:hypothetical protein
MMAEEISDMLSGRWTVTCTHEGAAHVDGLYVLDAGNDEAY